MCSGSDTSAVAASTNITIDHVVVDIIDEEAVQAFSMLLNLLMYDAYFNHIIITGRREFLDKNVVVENKRPVVHNLKKQTDYKFFKSNERSIEWAERLRVV